MKNKGQALIEFVLILPIFILILFAIVDFGMIINEKSSLENKSVDIVGLIKNDKSIEEIQNLYSDVKINISSENNYLKVTLASDIDIITPGLNRVLGDPYVVEVEWNVYND